MLIHLRMPQSQLQHRRTTVLLSTILLTVVYWFTALWYTNKTGQSKDLVVFHFLFKPILGSHPQADLYQYFYQFALTVLLYVCIPWLITKYYLKEDFASLGLRFTPNKTALLICGVVYPIVLASTYFSARQPDIYGEYPLSKLIGSSWLVFIIYQSAYLFYFIAYEVFYRGYLQFGLMSSQPSAKETAVILAIQTLITVLFHIGKPGSEIAMAAVFGPIIGYVAIRFNSIWYGMAIHFLMNVFMDFFILQYLHLLPSKFF